MKTELEHWGRDEFARWKMMNDSEKLLYFWGKATDASPEFFINFFETQTPTETDIILITTPYGESEIVFHTMHEDREKKEQFLVNLILDGAVPVKIFSTNFEGGITEKYLLHEAISMIGLN